MATLTGAARVALGPDLPPFYTDDEALAADLARHAAAENDPLWRMPLWRPYDKLLDSKTADVNNISSSPHGRLDHGGAVPAALRRAGQGLAASRHLCVDAGRQIRPGRKAANARRRARSMRC